MMLRVSFPILAIALMVSLAITAGCSSSADPTPTLVPATHTPIPTIASTVAVEYTATNTPLPKHTSTPTVTQMRTPEPADTPTAVPTVTNTPISTHAVVPSNTPTSAPTDTPLPTSTHIPTPAPTDTPEPIDTPTAVPTATHTPLPFHILANVPAFNPNTLPLIKWQFGDELPQDHKNAVILATKTMYDYALSLAEPRVEEIEVYAYRNLDNLLVAYAKFLGQEDEEEAHTYEDEWNKQGGRMLQFDFVESDSKDDQRAKKSAVFLKLDADINWTIENTAHELSHALRSSPGSGRIKWIEEGVAVYHSGRVLAELGFAEYDDFRNTRIQPSDSFKELTDIVGLQREGEGGQEYTEGFLAAELLASIAGEKALFDYNARVEKGGSSAIGTWYTPFKSAFGISPIQFYEIFNTHWDAGFPKLEVPDFPVSVQFPQASSSESDSCSNGVAVPNTQSNPDLISDCEILLELRDKLAGNGELNWTTNLSMLDWDGVTVSGPPSRVTELQLNVKGLTGQIPSELGKLSGLTNLSLGGNELTGEIPPELGNLTNMTRLWLGDNQLTGEIPLELGRISNLRWLWLGFNNLTGEIPSELSNLRNLEELSIRYNGLSGEIPSDLSNLVNVKFLRLEGNSFTGCVPDSLLIDSDSDHRDSGLAPCDIGTSPSDICSNGVVVPDPQSNPRLVSDCELLLSVLDTLDPTDQLDWWYDRPMENWRGITIDESTNRVTGIAPAYRDIIGKFPIELTTMDNLTHLDLSGNQLTGEIPQELANMPNLMELSLGANLFTGEIPVELANLTNLTALDLGSNKLTGQIPVELANLTNLTVLVLGINQLTGQIPVELSKLANLTYLSLYSNQLTGSIPVELTNLTDLTVLDLSDNQLTGEIPVGLGNLSDIELLLLHDNQLTGSIPADIGNLSSLTELRLRNNRITGEIPLELGNLPELNILQLDNNQLIGEIPQELGKLADLLLLDLSGNQLTGCIPESLRRIDESDLSELNMEFCNDSSDQP